MKASEPAALGLECYETLLGVLRQAGFVLRETRLRSVDMNPPSRVRIRNDQPALPILVASGTSISLPVFTS